MHLIEKGTRVCPLHGCLFGNQVEFDLRLSHVKAFEGLVAGLAEGCYRVLAGGAVQAVPGSAGGAEDGDVGAAVAVEIAGCGDVVREAEVDDLERGDLH